MSFGDVTCYDPAGDEYKTIACTKNIVQQYFLIEMIDL